MKRPTGTGKPSPQRSLRHALRDAPVTIHQIAAEARVSTATVSRALNQPERVSRRLRDRVMAIVSRHHYVSDGLAVGLASRRSQLIGLLIPSVTNSIYASSTQAIHRLAQRAGYTVLVGASDFALAQEEQLVRKLLERRVEGLILTGETRSPDIYETIRRNGVPFVITWQLTSAPDRPCVSFDNRKAALAAVEHLISLGHRRLALVCGRSDVNDRALARREAFKEGLARHKLPLDPDLIFERDFEFVEGSSAMHRMLHHRKRPTAVFCANDIQAIGALHQCRQSGVKVPDEMSIVGFDDLPISQYTTPQLTTVRVPAEEMGRRAAEYLLEAIEGSAAVPRIELPTDLIVRESTSRPRR